MGLVKLSGCNNMTQKTITVGTLVSPASLDTNFGNAQDNFTELYTQVGESLPLTVSAPLALASGDLSITFPGAGVQVVKSDGTFDTPLAVPVGPIVGKIASGTAALGTSLIASGAAASIVTVSAPGVAATDVINWGFNTRPSQVTGYAPLITGCLRIDAYPTTDNVNFEVSNMTGASITPAAMTLNWKVVR